MRESFVEEYSGSIFWLILTFISLMGLTLLGLWAFHNKHLQAFFVSFIFFGMIISGIVLAMLSNKKLYDFGTFTQSCVGFTIGFIPYYFIGGLEKSVLSLTENSLFSAVSSELPQAISVLMTGFVIPFSEEILWIIGIPYTLIAILDVAGKKYKFFKEPIVQIIIIGVVAATSFAFFHIGKLVLAFLLSALIFRLVMIFMILGDQKSDLLKFLFIPVSMAVGAHMGNNLAPIGIFQGFSIIFQYNAGIALILYATLTLFFLTAINGVIEFIYDKMSG